jgi:hypothetical protein
MPTLTAQRDYRAVQKLPFCYLCGKGFLEVDAQNRDHVPSQGIFLPADREPLWLPTHVSCNGDESATDEKIGQLIALRYGQAPEVHRQRLDIVKFAADKAALTNLDVDAAVWRWVRGCHTALYGEPLIGEFTLDIDCALTTPFPRAPKDTALVEPVRPQHLRFVETIKLNRFKANLDRVVTNKGKFTYECVWVQADGGGPWMCVFAINIYDWKDLGRTEQHLARGCAGFYIPPSKTAPPNATTAISSSIIIPNIDPLDPFAG